MEQLAEIIAVGTKPTKKGRIIVGCRLSDGTKRTGFADPLLMPEVGDRIMVFFPMASQDGELEG